MVGQHYPTPWRVKRTPAVLNPGSRLQLVEIVDANGGTVPTSCYDDNAEAVAVLTLQVGVVNKAMLTPREVHEENKAAYDAAYRIP